MHSIRLYAFLQSSYVIICRVQRSATDALHTVEATAADALHTVEAGAAYIKDRLTAPLSGVSGDDTSVAASNAEPCLNGDKEAQDTEAYAQFVMLVVEDCRWWRLSCRSWKVSFEFLFICHVCAVLPKF
jgi:hypothetical protein